MMRRIEKRGEVNVLCDDYGCSPATKAEAEFFDEITRLRAEVEALRADAERYRHLKANHLREYPDDNGTLCIEFWCDFDNWDDVDAAIDAARAAQGEKA